VILNTASISSNVAQKDQVQYDASKGAVQMITRGSALELAEHDIRVNAVAPGQIATEFVEDWSEEAPRDAANDGMIKPVPLKRAGYPEDIAPAFLYLASDAASYVTGELLTVDGGWSAF
jgi:NAD(P)-dependent dehydrogenase (short-subunit alcohol dehydrogenase family)